MYIMHYINTLYVFHRSRAFHEVWCPKEIGWDSWVRDATGISVQGIPPKNWGKYHFSFVNASRFKTKRPHNGIIVVVVVVVAAVVVESYSFLILIIVDVLVCLL